MEEEKDPVTQLSHSGYRIKNTPDVFKLIKSELTVKPFVLPDYDFNNKPFPVYRKNEKWIYLPKYYGIEKYGIPDRFLERVGVQINIKFNGKLKQEQIDISKNILEHICSHDSAVLSVPCGAGKCLAKNTPVLMYDGTIKMVQDITVGDQLMGDNSAPRNVLSINNGIEEMYEIKPHDSRGESYIVNKSHILSLKYNQNDFQVDKIIDISVEKYINLHDKYKNFLVGFRVPINFSYQRLPMYPYFLGILIGTSGKTCKFMFWFLITINFFVNVIKYILNFVFGTNNRINKNYNNFCRDILNNKHIPLIYRCNSRLNRLNLLSGILDACGNVTFDYTGYEIIVKNKTLSEDIKYLCRSLGFLCYGNGCDDIPETVLYIYSENIKDIPCLLKKKLIIPIKKNSRLVYKFEVIPRGTGEYYGFEIDGNRRFVLGGFDVTHNTVMALWIISQLKKKTLILVHKEFLLNQWVERIKEFLPNARIGIIQQNTIDIDNKDIVIGMVQSIVSRKYPSETFNSFGNLVTDECHRICSRTFSQALFHVGTKYSLGLSATPDRKDGLSKILNWFMGDIIVPDNNAKKYEPEVKLVQAEYFQKPIVKYNMRGKVNLPGLITTISLDFNRNNQIIEQIKLCIEQNRKIIVMSERREQCKELFDTLVSNGDSVGLYIGGMKEADMTISNTKQVILSTYAMCAEGYDNKNIDTLIMATGRSDIQQIVGRIMRQHNSNNPLIIDFQDNLEGLRGQSRVREKFYRKNKYKFLDVSLDTETETGINTTNVELFIEE